MTRGERSMTFLTARKKTVLGLAGLIISAAITGCSGSANTPVPSPTLKQGTLSGTALACIGPALPPGRDAVTVEVDISNSQGQRITQRLLHASGQAAYGPIPFSLKLPVGTYTASTSPAYDNSQKVQITPGRTSTVTLINVCL
jgi:hypothetical protein